MKKNRIVFLNLLFQFVLLSIVSCATKGDKQIRSSDRDKAAPSNRYIFLGLRLVRS